MLLKTMRKYYDKKYDLNCAECMLTAANEEYDLDLPKKAIKAMAAFGGGMGVGGACGAITGAIAAIGIMFAEDRGHASPQVKSLTVEFITSVNKEMNSIDCLPLKEKYFKNDTDRCIKIMDICAMELERVIEENKDKYTIYR